MDLTRYVAEMSNLERNFRFAWGITRVDFMFLTDHKLLKLKLCPDVSKYTTFILFWQYWMAFVGI